LLSKALQAQWRFNRALQKSGIEGMVGHDENSARRYASNPLLFFKEGAINRAMKPNSTQSPDPALEHLRRDSRRWTLIAAVALFVLLPLL
jgi:hypothetical protein